MVALSRQVVEVVTVAVHVGIVYPRIVMRHGNAEIFL
jgi:hypothetical protein